MLFFDLYVCWIRWVNLKHHIISKHYFLHICLCLKQLNLGLDPFVHSDYYLHLYLDFEQLLLLVYLNYTQQLLQLQLQLNLQLPCFYLYFHHQYYFLKQHCNCSNSCSNDCILIIIKCLIPVFILDAQPANIVATITLDITVLN